MNTPAHRLNPPRMLPRLHLTTTATRIVPRAQLLRPGIPASGWLLLPHESESEFRARIAASSIVGGRS